MSHLLHVEAKFHFMHRPAVAIVRKSSMIMVVQDVTANAINEQAPGPRNIVW